MIKPQSNKVLLLPDPRKTETASGIYIGETTGKSTEYGTVIAVGENIELVSEGQRVLFSPGAATEMPYEGVNYLMIREQDLLGVIE